MHGEMGYMERNREKRVDPTILVPGAKSVVSVLLFYNPGDPQVSTQPPRISRYALSVDYHQTVKEMLWSMLSIIRQEVGQAKGRAFVDSAPVLEREWAVRAGLGWIGKSGMLISPKLGTYTFIGELIVDIEIEASSNKIPDRCGSCTRCIDACPTGAIVAPRVVDARKCISYLTIEKKTPLTEEEKNSLNGWCFGCDICQEVCPWNGKVKHATNKRFEPRENFSLTNPQVLCDLPEDEFRSICKDTPIIRAGYEKFVQNCKLASG